MNLKATGHFPSTFIAVPFFLLFLLGSIDRTVAVDCGNCWCSEDVVTGYQNVICLGVPFTEIKNTFTGNTGFDKINSFSIVPKVGDTQIPAGLMGSHTARVIRLASCGDNLMTIRRNAFRSSANIMEEFVVYDCNIGSLTWLFLEGFTKVNLLYLEGATNIQSLETLPLLPNLKWLSITDCKGFSSLNFPGSSLSGLQNLIMTENVELTDGKAESILATLTGANNLALVSLKNNPYISRIPNTLANLVALHSLDVSMCDINSISSGSLSFSADVQLLDLTQNSLSDIPNNFFEKGYYGNAKVSLDGNQVTKFTSTVFLKILVEMQSSKTPGSVSIRNNPVKCDDCLMAWLIRDYRELLPFVSGQCSNATEFQDLNRSWYDDQFCKSLLTTTTTSSSTITISTTTPQSTTTLNPTTTSKPTSQTEPSTMSTASASVPDKSEIPTSTTAVQVTTTTTATNSTLPSGGTTMMPSTGSPTVTSGFSSTTTTVNNPNSTSTTTRTPSSSGSSTTQAPDPPAEQNYDIFFYILYGVLGGIALILIIGFIFLDYKRRKALKARSSLDDSSSRDSSLPRRMDPENYNPRSLEQRNLDPRPPASRQNDLGNYQQSRGQPYANPVSITTPYRQQPAINQPPPAPPTDGRGRGLRRVAF